MQVLLWPFLPDADEGPRVDSQANGQRTTAETPTPNLYGASVVSTASFAPLSIIRSQFRRRQRVGVVI